MKSFKETKIIGIDHGYGNMKTANHCFKTGISTYDSEPLFTADMLTFNGKYYIIGEGHKEFAPDKVKDDDYYVLTLAAIAKELKAENLTEAHVVIAAGLPLTWTSGQKADFKAYLSKNAEVEFVYKKTTYHIYIDDVRIYPQGYAAIASFATTLKGVNLIADIGNGTMNVATTTITPSVLFSTSEWIFWNRISERLTAKRCGYSYASFAKTVAHWKVSPGWLYNEKTGGLIL